MLDPIYLSPSRLARIEQAKAKKFEWLREASTTEQKERAEASMAWADSLTPEQREVLHEYGPVRTRKWLAGDKHPALQLITLSLVIQIEEGLL